MTSNASESDIVYDPPPRCWQDGLLLGNGRLGALFFAPEALHFVINHTAVLDGRVNGVRRVLPAAEARTTAAKITDAAAFTRLEQGDSAPVGYGPKSCAELILRVGMSGALPRLNSRLRLQEAELDVDIDKHLCHPRLRAFICSNEILALRVSDISPVVAPRSQLTLSRPRDVELAPPRLTQDKGRLLLHMKMPDAFDFVLAIAVMPRESKAYREDLLPRLRPEVQPAAVGTAQINIIADFARFEIDGDFDLFLTVVTTDDAADPATEAHTRLDHAATTGFEALRQAHHQKWQQFWHRSSVNLGEKTLHQLFHQSLYVLGSSYGNGGRMPGLCGLTYGPGPGPFQKSPWGGDYHWDQNAQCPFYPVHALNHSELFNAYLDTCEAMLPEARRLAREVWDAPGAHFDMCFNAAGHSIFGGVGTYRFFFAGSYVALPHCFCWRYRRDRKQLRERILPFLKEILLFYEHVMQKGEDGFYHLQPAHAPELRLPNTGDPVQAVSMLRVCLQTAIEACQILDTGHDLERRWSLLLEHLPPYPTAVDAHGRRIVLDAAGIPAEHHVNQAGGLRPVYPCGEICAESAPAEVALYRETFAAAVAKSSQLIYADDNSFHFLCAWQCFHYAMTALRLGLKQQFLDFYLPTFLKCYVKPNGLMSHDATVVVSAERSEKNLLNIPAGQLLDAHAQLPVFEMWCGHDGGTSDNPDARRYSLPLVEANADFLTMVTEMLLQSHGGLIRLFPAWPRRYDATFNNFLAEGNILVSACFRKGHVHDFTLTRAADADDTTPIRYRCPWTAAVQTCELQPGESCQKTEPPTNTYSD